ncbi:hypothetical protein Tco_1075402, partial [Tanacetum coccineum]
DEEEDKEHDSDDDHDDNDDEDDDQEHDSQRTESDDSGDDFVHPNLSTYKADEEEEEREEEKANDDDEVISDQKVSTPPDYELTKEDENQHDDTMGGNKKKKKMRNSVAFIPGIVDNYLTSKMKDEVNVALLLKSDKLRQEAQAENQDFLNSLDSNIKRIIKEQVKAKTSKIMTKVEKYVTKTLGAE